MLDDFIINADAPLMPASALIYAYVAEVDAVCHHFMSSRFMPRG